MSSSWWLASTGIGGWHRLEDAGDIGKSLKVQQLVLRVPHEPGEAKEYTRCEDTIMGIAVEAVWEKGVLTPKTRLNLPEKTNVRLIVETPAKSTLEADLRAIRARIVASGVPLLDDEEVLAQVHANRGGYDHEGASNQ